ncbi:hypothetical protein [Streptococcus suis]|uniref:hypothetical protein n=1 Tax=Streptococcus suis TaxID=1307 RepID=UPI003BA1AA08
MKKAAEYATSKLENFKERMRITHEIEDDKLIRMLTSSALAIATLVGASSFDDTIEELVLERAMYLYHDSLDEFQKNYSDEIEILYLRNMIIANEGSDDATE